MTFDLPTLMTGLIGGIVLGVLIAPILLPRLRWNREQRDAVASADAQTKRLLNAPDAPPLNDYRKVTSARGTTVHVIDNIEPQDHALSRKA